MIFFTKNIPLEGNPKALKYVSGNVDACYDTKRHIIISFCLFNYMHTEIGLSIYN